jgi:hypothetical protein
MGFLSLISPKRRSPGEHDREDLQPQLVDEVVLYERAQEGEAGGDENLSLELLLQLRDFGHGSPLSTFQAGSLMVEDPTYLGMLLNLSANSPLRDGHRAANRS